MKGRKDSNKSKTLKTPRIAKVGDVWYHTNNGPMDMFMILTIDRTNKTFTCYETLKHGNKICTWDLDCIERPKNPPWELTFVCGIREDSK